MRIDGFLMLCGMIVVSIPIFGGTVVQDPVHPVLEAPKPMRQRFKQMSFASRPICLIVIAVAFQLCVMCGSRADTGKIDPAVDALLRQSAAAYNRLKSYQHTEIMKITVNGPIGAQS